MRTLNANEVVRNDARFAAILAIDIAHSSGIGRGHGLHTHGSINLCKILTHIFDAFFAKGAGPLSRSDVHGKAIKVHDMATTKCSERLDSLEHALVTNRTIALKLLRDAVVSFFVLLGHGHAGVATHAVAVIDAESLAGATDVAEWAVVDFLRRTIVK